MDKLELPMLIENASIDQKEVIKKINSNTRAIIIVNLWVFLQTIKFKNLCERKIF